MIAQTVSAFAALLSCARARAGSGMVCRFWREGEREEEAVDVGSGARVEGGSVCVSHVVPRYNVSIRVTARPHWWL